MKGYASKEMRRFNYLIVETDAVYHEAALKLGLSDSAIPSAIMTGGTHVPCRRSPAGPASANRPSILPYGSWRRRA